ncbi:protein of unknown function [Streptomyces sp. KY70]|nr:protein of unknown function [Streptomyces sp. KY70]
MCSSSVRKQGGRQRTGKGRATDSRSPCTCHNNGRGTRRPEYEPDRAADGSAFRNSLR